MKNKGGRPATRKAVNGEKIKTLMNQKGIDYRRLADDIGFTRSYVNVSIKYDVMSASMLEAVAKYFKVPEEELWQK